MSGSTDDAEILAGLFVEASNKGDFPFNVSPLGAWMTGLCIFLFLNVITWLWIVLVTDVTAFEAIEVANISIVAVTAYTLTMNEVGRRGFMHDYAALSPSLILSDSEKVAILRPELEQRTKIRIIAGIIFALVATPLVTFFVLIDRTEEQQIVSASFVLLVIMFFVVGGAMYDTFVSYRRLLGLMKPGLKIDLLDLRPLEVIGRTGVRIALMMAIGAALATPLLAEENALIITSIFLIALLGGAFMVMVLPAHEASRAIRGAKDRELRRVNDLIRTVRNGMKNDIEDSQKMQGLIAYRSMIVDINEWPIGMPTLVRVLVIALVPIASVFGGVFLEQLVEGFM